MIYVIDMDANSAEAIRSFYQYDRFKNVYYQYDLNNDILTINITIVYPDHFNFDNSEFNIKIPIDEYAGQYIIVKILKDFSSPENEKESLTAELAHYLYPILDFDYANLYSRGYNIKDIGSDRFVSLYITKDAKDIYIHPFYRLNDQIYDHTKITYIEKPMINSDHIGMLLSSCQEFQEYYNKWHIKKKTIDPTVDISKSASYLEAEIDVLYKIIELLLEKTEVNASEYKPVMDAVARHSILDIKDINKLVSEIDEDKANIRKRQEIFYKEAYEEQ